MAETDPAVMLFAGALAALVMAVVAAFVLFAWNAMAEPQPHAWVCGNCLERFAARGAFIAHECKRGFIDV